MRQITERNKRRLVLMFSVVFVLVVTMDVSSVTVNGKMSGRVIRCATASGLNVVDPVSPSAMTPGTSPVDPNVPTIPTFSPTPASASGGTFTPSPSPEPTHPTNSEDGKETSSPTPTPTLLPDPIKSFSVVGGDKTASVSDNGICFMPVGEIRIKPKDEDGKELDENELDEIEDLTWKQGKKDITEDIEDTVFAVKLGKNVLTCEYKNGEETVTKKFTIYGYKAVVEKAFGEKVTLKDIFGVKKFSKCKSLGLTNKKKFKKYYTVSTQKKTVTVNGFTKKKAGAQLKYTVKGDKKETLKVQVLPKTVKVTAVLKKKKLTVTFSNVKGVEKIWFKPNHKDYTFSEVKKPKNKKSMYDKKKKYFKKKCTAYYEASIFETLRKNKKGVIVKFKYRGGYSSKEMQVKITK